MKVYLASRRGPSTDSRMKAMSELSRTVEKISIGGLRVEIGRNFSPAFGLAESCCPKAIPHGCPHGFNHPCNIYSLRVHFCTSDLRTLSILLKSDSFIATSCRLVLANSRRAALE